MMQTLSILMLCCLWLQNQVAQPPAGAKTTVTPISVSETRFRSIEKEPNTFGNPAGIKVTLRVQGPAVEGATAYGHLKLTEAVDDAGTDLKSKEPMFHDEQKFQPLNSGMAGMMQKKDEKGFRMEISMGPSARKATKIKSVKGEFEVVAGGKEETVSVKNVHEMYGKTIDDPQLKAAGVKIKVLDPKQDGGGVSLEITGTLTAVQDVQVLDKSGENQVFGHFSQDMDGKRTASYQLKEPLNDAMTLKIKVMVGQKTVKVPFELKDVVLP